MFHHTTLLQLLVTFCALLAAASVGRSGDGGPLDVGADRYGGVWQSGEASGAFVPISAGMTWPDLLAYRSSWGNQNLRIVDLEVVPQDCSADEKDLFATQWETGKWEDKLVRYSSAGTFANALMVECANGYTLTDFEIWESLCEGISYIALYRETGKCVGADDIVFDSAPEGAFLSLAESYAQSGYKLVDVEAFQSVLYANAAPLLHGVWYLKTTTQELSILTRAQFEQEMNSREGEMTLTDMESYRVTPILDFGDEERFVLALWEDKQGTDADDHEVGEVYSKFRDLIYQNSSTRKLTDFEVYANTLDRRFSRTFNKYLSFIGGGWSVAVMQSGELVGCEWDGWARIPDSSGSAGIRMGLDTRGPVASVTKFFTALGVLTYAETTPDPNAWLDQPFVAHLPPDFGPFGLGVSTVTLRDLMKQETGLATFSSNESVITNSAGVRQDIIDWLGQPLADPLKEFDYQNIHFELLAIIMNEVELPLISSSTEPWTDWMNTMVFGPAGCGYLLCGGSSTDALSYPLGGSQNGIEGVDSSWSCGGFGTGSGMFWASSLDLAKVNSAFRNGQLVSPAMVSMVLEQGLGLDTSPPLGDGNPSTIGEQLYYKNGGFCSPNAQAVPAGSETYIIRYDDYNIDDIFDLGAPAPPETNDYEYEVGYRDFDIGYMNHTSPFPIVCYEEAKFPPGFKILQEALLQPEDW